jgi:hypothetical protein
MSHFLAVIKDLPVVTFGSLCVFSLFATFYMCQIQSEGGELEPSVIKLYLSIV